MEAPEKKITRSDLPLVVKRAAELAARDADPAEEISEDEVIRIAAELGLPAHHVRTALYEAAHHEGEPTFLDRQFGNRRVVASRVVPHDAEKSLRKVEELFKGSNMTVVRRQAGSITLEAGGDMFSKITRAFRGQNQLASAEIVEVIARKLETGGSHVTVRAVFKDERKGHFAGAVIGGTLLGASIGSLAGVLAGVVTHEMIVGMTTGTILGIGSGGGIYAGILASMKKNYREWRERVTRNTEGTLDKLEKAQDTLPPTAQWFQKLQKKLEEL